MPTSMTSKEERKIPFSKANENSRKACLPISVSLEDSWSMRRIKKFLPVLNCQKLFARGFTSFAATVALFPSRNKYERLYKASVEKV
jgi:hypothetical protein